jgi:hypothetical protein
VVGDPARSDLAALRQLEDPLADAADLVLAERSERAVDVARSGRAEELEVGAAAGQGVAGTAREVGDVLPRPLAADESRRGRAGRRSERRSRVRVVGSRGGRQGQHEHDE